MRTVVLGVFGVLAGLVVLLGGCSPSGGGLGTGSDRPAFRAADFDALVGHAWRGTLEYKDYSTGKFTTVRSSLRVCRVASAGEGVDSWSFAIGYADEPNADSATTARLLDGGTAVESDGTIERVVRRWTEEHQAGGNVCEVITESRGEDDNRPATIRRKFRFSAGQFEIRKMVKFDNAADYFKRYEYRWTRE